MSIEEMLMILTILGSLAFGVVVGFFVRGKNLSKIGKIITILIWVLLFCLGVKLGANEEVVAKLPTMGLEALAITLGAIIGSVFFAWLLWRLVTKRN